MSTKILGGLYKGANLFTPSGADIRPALARMKNSLFNILIGRLEGARALDLFAGTGGLGIEALSRGAEYCLFIDNNSACIDAVKKSIAKLRLEKQAKAVLLDSFNIVSYALDAKEKFNLVFIDPPYKYYDDCPEREKLFGVIRDVAEKDILARGGIIIVEHRSDRASEHRSNKKDEEALENIGCLVRFDLRNYGQTCLSFLKRKKATTDTRR
ncbi:MAG: 16S rRNA (guanine(966)-N(2))-methyltransferase RsmD [Planctomycetota bacterium]